MAALRIGSYDCSFGQEGSASIITLMAASIARTVAMEGRKNNPKKPKKVSDAGATVGPMKAMEGAAT